MAKSPSKPMPTAQPNPDHKMPRINFRRILILGVLVLVLGLSYFPIRYFSDRSAKATSLAQAKTDIQQGQVDNALKNLQRYLENWPNDVTALEMEARLMADHARSIDELNRAVEVNDQLLRLNPTGPTSLETKLRLTRLYVDHGDTLRAIAEARKEPGFGNKEIRYRAAIILARQVIADQPQNAQAHRLLAMALDGVVAKGDASVLNEAIEEYDTALKFEPGDVQSTERQAYLLLDRRKDLPGGEEALDKLLKLKPADLAVRLARYRFYSRAQKPDQARVELERARELAPNDAGLGLIAASDALRRNDPAAARKALDAIPAAEQGNMRVRLLRGMVEFAERHPSEAIEQWREGLVSSRGTDLDLTWRLAHAMLLMERTAEARPLVAQYQRLEKDDPLSMGRFLRALLVLRSGRPAQAIPDFERASDKLPDAYQAELQQHLGTCYEAIGDEGRALIAYQRAAILAPKNPGPRRSVIKLLMTRNPAEAKAELKRAIAQLPDNPELLFDLSKAELAAQMAKPVADRRFDELESYLAHGEKVAPNEEPLRKLRSTYLMLISQPNQAIELLAKAAHGPDRQRVDVWVDYADAYLRLNRGEEAIKILEQASQPENAGDHAGFRLGKAQIHASLGRGQLARDELTKNVDKIPKSERAELLRGLGEMLRGMGDRDGTRTAFAEWARVEPDRPRAGLALLALAQVNGDDEAARLGLDALRAIGGENEPYGLAAEAFELLRTDRDRPDGPVVPGRLDKAERLSEKLQIDAPQLPLAQLVKAMVLERRNKPNEAINAYRLSLKDLSMTTSALPRLIVLLTQQKRYSEIAALKQSLNDQMLATGNGSSFSDNFDRLAAEASLRFGDKDRAEQLLAQIVEAKPDDLSARAVQAQLLDSLGKKEEALATLTDLVNRQPDNSTSWIALVTYQKLRGTREEAVKTIDQAQKTYKGPRLEVLLGRCRWIIGDIDTAATFYDLALKKSANDLTTIRAVYEFNQSNGRGSYSEQTLRQALKLDPSTSWAARALALLLASKPDEASWNEAWALVAPVGSGSSDAPEDRLVRAAVLSHCPEKARRLEAGPALIQLAEDLPISSPVGVEARIRLATALLEFDRPADAVKYIEPVASAQGRVNPIVLSLAAESLARSGRVDDALAILTRLTVIEPASPKAVAARIWILKAQGKIAEATTAVEKALSDFELAPDGETTCVAFLELLSKFNQPEASERAARRVASRWPREAYLVGHSQLQRKDYAGALSSATAALEAGAAREAIRLATGVAIARRDDADLMKQINVLCEAALAKAPTAADVLIFAGTIRHLQGRYTDEMPLYRRALENNPTNLGFLNNMAWTLSEGLGQTDEALDKINIAIRREGPNPASLDTRGVIYTRKGQLDLAIADLELSVKGEPAATTYFHLARAYARAGKPLDLRRCRDLARANKFNPAELDPTDRTDLEQIMNGP